jgi:hypothetical protein
MPYRAIGIIAAIVSGYNLPVVSCIGAKIWQGHITIVAGSIE